MFSARIDKIHALVFAFTLTLMLGTAPSVLAQQEIGSVSAGPGRAVYVIAIPPFQATGQALTKPVMSDVIMNDLKLSGYFAPPSNPQFVLETNQLDLKTNSINFAEWKRIGALYLVKGTYRIQGNDLVTEVKTYDNTGGQYIFGKRYENYAISDARELCHRISNDIIERITTVPGIANTKITFVRSNDRRGQSKQVSVMDADGFNQRAVSPLGELTATPCWGMRGGEIYYTTYRDYNPDLRGLILRSNASWWISRRAGFNLSPDWSEKQQQIALTLTKDGNSEIYTMNREGKDLRRMTINRAIDSSPCWSPDGSKIAFTSDRSGAPQIWVMDARTLDAHRISYQGTYNDGATWAPAGTNRIAYSSRIDGTFQIFTMNPDGTDVQQITNGSSDSEDPCWAPNGYVLAFTSNRTGEKQIYTMFADGSNVHQLTTGAPCQSAQWGPAMP